MFLALHTNVFDIYNIFKNLNRGIQKFAFIRNTIIGGKFSLADILIILWILPVFVINTDSGSICISFSPEIGMLPIPNTNRL